MTRISILRWGRSESNALRCRLPLTSGKSECPICDAYSSCGTALTRAISCLLIPHSRSARVPSPYTFGEKSVNVKNVDSDFSTSFPFASLAALTRTHSGSAWNAAQFAVAASRLGCFRM